MTYDNTGQSQGHINALEHSGRPTPEPFTSILPTLSHVLKPWPIVRSHSYGRPELAIYLLAGAKQQHRGHNHIKVETTGLVDQHQIP